MSQQHPLPHSFQDLNQYLSSIPAPPPTNLGSYNVQTLTQVQASASGHDPDSTSYHPGAFSPSQLSALLDERILELGALPITEADMNLGGIDFPALQRTYRITPIQQPERSAAFEGSRAVNYLERLPLSPPLIIQLDCWDSQGDLEIPHDELPFLVVHLTLETAEGEDATMVQLASGEVVSMVYGTLVTAPTEMVNTDGAAGVYFCFPDVSVRFAGEFRLKANLMRITGGHTLAEAYTDYFEIVEQSEYTAPDVTDLTRHFDSQGVVSFGLPRNEW